MKSIWLLYVVDHDCRQGERFMHAFVGYPSYEELCKVINITPADYLSIVQNKYSTPYSLEEQE